MPKLRDILLLTNFNEYNGELPQNQLLAWVKLLAYRRCFDKPYAIETKENISSARIIELTKELIPIWELTGLNEVNSTHHNRIISDAEAEKLLDIPFSSYESGYIWLRNITQIHFLRKDFDQEGLTREKEQVGLCYLRMLEEKCINLEEVKNSKQDSMDYQLYQITSALHLLDHAPWPTGQTIGHVVLLGHVDKFIQECIDFIEDFNGTLYYLTGPRGLFNYEEALAPILADWFGMPDKIDIIRQVLAKHSNIRDPLQWTMDLSALKLEIMKALQVDHWPKAPQSYYYKEKESFDAVSDELKREHLDCLGGPWPVAMDMVEYRLKQKQKKHPGQFENIKLVQVITTLRNNKLPSIDHTIETWYQQYGHELLEHNKNPIFIGCSLSHRLSYIVNTIVNKLAYKDSMKKQALSNKIQHFIEEKKSVEECKIQVIGPAAKELNMVLALDSLAKTFFTLDKNIKTIINDYELYRSLKKIDTSDEQAALAIKMMHYKKYLDHLSLATSTFDLAKSFHSNVNLNLIKTAGLLNFAMSVLKSAKSDKYSKIIQSLYQCTLVNMKIFLTSSLARLNLPTKLIDLDGLKKLDNQNMESLFNIRKKIYSQLKKLTNEHDKELYTIYKNCLEERTKFFTDLVNQSLMILGEHPVKYEFVYFGSNSRVQATPFSDIEFMMLLEKNDEYIQRFSIELAKILLMKILNLGETYLVALDIILKDKQGNEYHLSKIFDCFTQVGYSYDGHNERSSMAPLGRKPKDPQGKKVRLIGTPEKMAKMVVNPKTFDDHAYFSQSLRLTKLINTKTSNKLYKAYRELLKSDKRFNSYVYAVWLLRKDIKGFINIIEESFKLNQITHEKYFYRPISALIDDLYLLLNPVENAEPLVKLMLLEKYEIISANEKEILQNILQTVLYLRIHMHYSLWRHEVNFSNTNLTIYNKFNSARMDLYYVLNLFNDRLNMKDIHNLKLENSLNQKVINQMFFFQFKSLTKDRFGENKEYKENKRKNGFFSVQPSQQSNTVTVYVKQQNSQLPSGEINAKFK